MTDATADSEAASRWLPLWGSLIPTLVFVVPTALARLTARIQGSGGDGTRTHDFLLAKQVL